MKDRARLKFELDMANQELEAAKRARDLACDSLKAAAIMVEDAERAVKEAKAALRRAPADPPPRRESRHE